MTPQEEIYYLTDLLLEATRWQCSEGEKLDPLQLEVKDRLARLTGQQSINVEGVPSDKVQPKSNDKDYEYKAKWASNRVRVKMPDGSYQWHLKDECEKIPVPGQNGKWKWGLKQKAEQPEPPEFERNALSY